MSEQASSDAVGMRPMNPIAMQRQAVLDEANAAASRKRARRRSSRGGGGGDEEWTPGAGGNDDDGDDEAYEGQRRRRRKKKKKKRRVKREPEGNFLDRQRKQRQLEAERDRVAVNRVVEKKRKTDAMVVPRTDVERVYYIVQWLRETRARVLLEDIGLRLQNNHATHVDWMSVEGRRLRLSLQQNPRIEYDADDGLYTFRPHYRIHGMAELRTFFEGTASGVDRELLSDSYHGVERDVAVLLEEGFVISLYNASSRRDVLYRTPDAGFALGIDDEIKMLWNKHAQRDLVELHTKVKELGLHRSTRVKPDWTGKQKRKRKPRRARGVKG